MSWQVFALLVGINEYSPNVGKLSGCLKDVEHFHSYLPERFGKSQLHVEKLKDSDAMRSSVIQQFRSHLCQSKSDDIVIFQYGGNGARCKLADAFKECYPSGNVQISMDGNGRTLHNVFIEGLWRTVKHESLSLYSYEADQALQLGLLKYLTF